MPENDRLEDIFKRQEAFMEELRSADRLPEWPVDLTTKPGQRLIKETIYNSIEVHTALNVLPLQKQNTSHYFGAGVFT